MNEYVVEVAEGIGVQLVPLVEYDHSTVGVGVPDAAAVNVAVAPDATETFCGCLVTCGAPLAVTVRVAGLVVVSEPP